MNNQIVSTTFLLLAALTGSSLVSCQFLQPQSHLGRLVQSITSPLVLASGGGGSGDDSYNDPSSYYSPGGNTDTGSADVPEQAHTGRQQAHLQQAPSQQRGVPQQYYSQPIDHGSSHRDDDRDQGIAPSSSKQTQEYQMGAYLGPTMDDKEINGAFNSNDDRDDDDGPSGYDGPSGGLGGRNRAAASNTYSNGGGDGYGPVSGGSSSDSYDRRPGAGGYGAGAAAGPYGNSAAPGPYDDDGADEDDMPAQSGRGGSRGGSRGGYRGGLSQAASHYQQQQGGGYGSSAANSRGSPQSGQMMAAANGYAPYGYSGPVDLTGIMSGDPNSGYQVYNGDGSYPGANYYQQQQRPQRGGRNQAASNMNNGYYNNQGYGPGSADGNQQPDRQANSDNDDHDMNDADDD